MLSNIIPHGINSLATSPDSITSASQLCITPWTHGPPSRSEKCQYRSPCNRLHTHTLRSVRCLSQSSRGVKVIGRIIQRCCNLTYVPPTHQRTTAISRCVRRVPWRGLPLSARAQPPACKASPVAGHRSGCAGSICCCARTRVGYWRRTWHVCLLRGFIDHAVGGDSFFLSPANRGRLPMRKDHRAPGLGRCSRTGLWGELVALWKGAV